MVKTRLQVEARTGQTHYKGMADAFVKICECGMCEGGHSLLINIRVQTRRRASRHSSKEDPPELSEVALNSGSR